jgi:hypothetical protein
VSNKDQPISIGPGSVDVLVKPHGQRGGYRYVLTNGPTGAIFSVKANADPSEWNLFVSVRALRLLTLGYEQTKHWLFETLSAMGCTLTGHSVNRLDFAVDILAPDFVLDAQNFVCPAQSKAHVHWSKDTILDDDGNVPQSVLRGRRFESVTIGRMPNRQVIVYDKRRAAIDLNQPYWFDAWGIERDDPGGQVWRVEIRAGRDALAKRLLTRTFEAVEGEMQAYLTDAATDIRYVKGKDLQKNVSRAAPHPLWQTVGDVLAQMPVGSKPPLPEARVLEFMRAQRRDMALKQACGNLINVLVLDGESPEEIARWFPRYTTRAAHEYVRDLGKAILLRKSEDIEARLGFLLIKKAVDPSISASEGMNS